MRSLILTIVLAIAAGWMLGQCVNHSQIARGVERQNRMAWGGEVKYTLWVAEYSGTNGLPAFVGTLEECEAEMIDMVTGVFRLSDALIEPGAAF